MKVVEIFKSIDGEGKRAGLPTTFIRLFESNVELRKEAYSLMSLK